MGEQVCKQMKELKITMYYAFSEARISHFVSMELRYNTYSNPRCRVSSTSLVVVFFWSFCVFAGSKTPASLS